ncbi:MAG: Na/Pi cotransporter family protein [Lachnospiraceae bacterium]|nr:Na/Pi cotransporter family protein [Lachnospiraceae bacterium]
MFDFFSFLTMIGGLAMFLYGMSAMGDGLAKLAGGKLERILEKLTSNPIMGVFLGFVVTAVIQSSSATTVMVVGFVNSGIMRLSQAISIIMGANIGTTATAWILSLAGLEGGNFVMNMLKPTSFSPILAIIGVAMLMFSNKAKKKDLGTILIGFAILMFGMDTMTSAIKPLAEVQWFKELLVRFSNPILGLMAGAILTAVIQSSSASVGILQAMSMNGLITFGTAFPIIMGQNIGTCVTALISSIGATKNGKRTAFVHLYFNLIGTIIFMAAFYIVNAIVNFTFMEGPISGTGIAVLHSIFNISATLVLLPCRKLLEKLACLTIRDKDVKGAAEGAEESEIKLLDYRFLDKPSFAVEQCRNVTHKMAELSKDAIFKAMSLLKNYDEGVAEEVIHLEGVVDKYEDQLGSYLVKLSGKATSEEDSRTVSLLLHSIGDYERISDHAINILESAKEMHEKGMVFSKKAMEELEIFTRAVEDIMNMTLIVFMDEDVDMAKSVEPLEEMIDFLSDELKNRHIARLREGKCTIEQGFVFSDITTNFERISDHCSNIAVSLIEIKDDEYDTHRYLDTVKHDSARFAEEYANCRERYALPL